MPTLVATLARARMAWVARSRTSWLGFALADGERKKEGATALAAIGSSTRQPPAPLSSWLASGERVSEAKARSAARMVASSRHGSGVSSSAIGATPPARTIASRLASPSAHSAPMALSAWRCCPATVSVSAPASTASLARRSTRLAKIDVERVEPGCTRVSPESAARSARATSSTSLPLASSTPEIWNANSSSFLRSSKVKVASCGPNLLMHCSTATTRPS